MSFENMKFYSYTIWKEIDKSISQNVVSIESMCHESEYGTSPLKLKLCVKNVKNGINDCVSFSYSDLFVYLLKVKSITDTIGEFQKEVQTNNKAKKDFTHQVGKNKLHILFGHKPEIGICVRIYITNKEAVDETSDDVRAYLPLTKFMAMSKLMGDFRDQYITSSASSQLFVAMSNLNSTMESISSKITGYFLESKSSLTPVQTVKPDSIIPVDFEIKEEARIHDEMNNFLMNNIDKIKLDIDPSFATKSTEEEPQTETNLRESPFKDKCLKRNFKHFSDLISGCIMEDNPLDSFCRIISEKLGISKKEIYGKDLNDDEIKRTIFMTSRYVKHYISSHLEHKTKIPESSIPVVYTPTNVNNINNDIRSDIYLFMNYLTCVRNLMVSSNWDTTTNKSILSFTTKTMLSPLVFSFMSNTTKDVFIHDVCTRYDEYKKSGFFKEFEDEILNKTGLTIDISTQSIRERSETVYDLAVVNVHKFSVDKVGPMLEKAGIILDVSDNENNIEFREQISDRNDSESEGIIDFVGSTESELFN